jgi:hypothetical protein
VQEAARYLAAAPSGDATASVSGRRQAGDRAGADDKRIEVVKPNGDSRWLSPAPHAGEQRARHAVVFDETDEPGLYRVRGARADGTVDDRPDAVFAVTLDRANPIPRAWPTTSGPIGPARAAPVGPRRAGDGAVACAGRGGDRARAVRVAVDA